MINVLILFSGSNQGFKDAGYAYPKNLVEIAGAPLVQHVLEHLTPLEAFDARQICLFPHDENARHYTGAVIHLLKPSAVLIEVKGNTSGAACSALLAVEQINNDQPLIIVNGDQILNADLAAVVRDFQGRQLDGGIVVFEDIHPRWSFVKCDAAGFVVETAEKRPISRLATAGFYYFARGSDYVLAASESIKKDAHVNGSFYICPVYNELILRQHRIGVHLVPRRAYRSLATPADVHAYAAALNPLSA
jgi:dTDP-glucose pyrophosphorylase